MRRKDYAERALLPAFNLLRALPRAPLRLMSFHASHEISREFLCTLLTGFSGPIENAVATRITFCSAA